MSARKDYIRVTVVEPGPGDGPNLYRIVRGPGVRRRESCGHADRPIAEAEAAELADRLNAQLAGRRPPAPRGSSTVRASR